MDNSALPDDSIQVCLHTFPVHDAHGKRPDQKHDKQRYDNKQKHDLSEEDADDLIRDFRDEYQGQYDDEEDFAYEIIEECYDLPEFAKTYFDYEKFARDLFMCDYWFDDGFVFRAA